MHSTQLQEVNNTTRGIMNGDTKCNKNMGMNNMVKVTLPGKVDEDYNALETFDKLFVTLRNLYSQTLYSHSNNPSKQY